MTYNNTITFGFPSYTDRHCGSATNENSNEIPTTYLRYNLVRGCNIRGTSTSAVDVFVGAQRFGLQNAIVRSFVL